VIPTLLYIILKIIIIRLPLFRNHGRMDAREIVRIIGFSGPR